MINLFIWIAFFLTGVLSVYGMSILIPSIFFGRRRLLNKDVQNSESTDKSFDILIPCHNEGAELLDTVFSIENQSYSGIKNIYLLFKDLNDNSIPFLQKKFGKDLSQTILLKNKTYLKIILTERQQKKDKLNFYLPKTSSFYVAFLDADHVAANSWLQKSHNILEKNNDANVCGVQSRRKPKSIKNFFQLWDSAQNHVGNELLNLILVGSGQSIFFTGTTAVFKANEFRENYIPDSITEDTYLSYQLISKGKKIIYNNSVGSFESVSPTLTDYIARRRRWANGHNQSFFENIRNIFSSKKITMLNKSSLFFHGIFYLIPLIALVLVFLFQGYIFSQFPVLPQIAIMGITVFLSILINVILSKSYGVIIKDIIFGSIVIFPFVVFFSLFFFRFFDFNFYYYLLVFPFLNFTFGDIQIVLFSLPLIILLVGFMKVKLFKLYQIAIITISYPLIIFIDLYSSMLGFSDYLFGIKKWRPIQRNTHSWLNKKILLFAFVTVFIISSLFSLFFYKKSLCNDGGLFNLENKEFSVGIEKKSHPTDNLLLVNFSGILALKSVDQLTFTINNSEEFIVVDNNGYFNHQIAVPFGFNQQHVQISAPKSSCTKNLIFTDTLKEIKGNKVLINNEPFLVKGVVSNFLQPDINLSLEEGFGQIADLNANLVRSYYPMSESLIESSSEKGLLHIMQPRLSTWGDNDFSYLGTSGLLKRFRDLDKRLEHEPYTFSVNLGNELEIQNSANIPRIENILTEIQNDPKSHLSTYATFSPHLRYPGDIISVNMLDTGDVYWNKAIPILSRSKRPFLATELGGFAAFYEFTDPRIRSLRLIDHWEKLLSLGGIGGIIFQSHDNWAQPIITGFNNPFIAEQADDMRGIWNRDNSEKFIAQTVRSIFNDFNVRYLNTDIFNDRVIAIELTNTRNYKLQNIFLYKNNRELFSYQDLSPGDSVMIEIQREQFNHDHIFSIKYETHSGIIQNQILNTPTIIPDPQPFFPDPSAFFLQEERDKISGDILRKNSLVFVPDNWEIENNHISNQSRKDILNTEVYHKPKIITIYSEEKNAEINSFDDVDRGVHTLTFRFEDTLKPESLLILEGLAAFEARLTIDGTDYTIQVHPYRENIISLVDYIDHQYDGEIIVTFNREFIVYLSREYSPESADIKTNLIQPKLFQPEKIIINKIK